MPRKGSGIRPPRRYAASSSPINDCWASWIKATPLLDAFKAADDVLRQAIQGIADVITTTGLVNASISPMCGRSCRKHTGRAVMGMGIGRGANRAQDAAQQAICSPLWKRAVEWGLRVLLNITGGPNMSLHEAGASGVDRATCGGCRSEHHRRAGHQSRKSVTT